MSSENMRFKAYRNLDGTNRLTITLEDGIERKILKFAIFLNPDRDACFVYTPTTTHVVKRGLLSNIPKEQRRQEFCFDTDIFAFVVDIPYRSIRIPAMPLIKEINEQLAIARLYSDPISVSEAEKILSEWDREVKEGRI
jgi:hypothetical protein